MTSPSPSPSFSASLGFKILILVVLCIQNSGHTLTMRYSRGIMKETYLISAVVIVQEFVKLCISTFVVFRQHSFNVSSTLQRLRVILSQSAVMAVPGILYFVQNKLQFVGLQHLNPSVYSILSQAKLITTAIFSVLLLRKKLHWYQWRALILLVIGVVLVQARPSAAPAASTTPSESASAVESGFYIGFVATVVVTCLSGLSGVYFEWQLKRTNHFNMWDRNVQLSLYGIVFGYVGMYFTADDYEFLTTHSFFEGFSSFTVVVIAFGSLGGLLVAVVVTYTDNIIKGFATSFSLILTSLISYFIFHDLFADVAFFCGTLCVMISVFNYNEDLPKLGRDAGPGPHNISSVIGNPAEGGKKGESEESGSTTNVDVELAASKDRALQSSDEALANDTETETSEASTRLLRK